METRLRSDVLLIGISDAENTSDIPTARTYTPFGGGKKNDERRPESSFLFEKERRIRFLHCQVEWSIFIDGARAREKEKRSALTGIAGMMMIRLGKFQFYTSAVKISLLKLH